MASSLQSGSPFACAEVIEVAHRSRIYVMISILIDPTFRPPPVTIPARTLMANPVRHPEHPLDHRILALLRDAPEPISAWRIANMVAAAQNPASRSENRKLRLQVLRRVNPLVKAGFARRIGRAFLTVA